jgi:hypothetical protein
MTGVAPGGGRPASASRAVGGGGVLTGALRCQSAAGPRGSGSVRRSLPLGVISGGECGGLRDLRQGGAMKLQLEDNLTFLPPAAGGWLLPPGWRAMASWAAVAAGAGGG